MRALTYALTAISLTLAVPAAAQGAPDTEQLEQQRTAMAKLAMLDGEWRGPATITSRAGPRDLTQTERVGTMLDGTIRVIEGRGYNEAGETEFNAFAVISYDPETASYSMQSWAQGRSGKFPLTPTDTGFEWEIPAGPGAKIHYTATVDGTTWHEVGQYMREGAPPMTMVDLTLTRIGDTDWPKSGSVAPE